MKNYHLTKIQKEALFLKCFFLYWKTIYRKEAFSYIGIIKCVKYSMKTFYLIDAKSIQKKDLIKYQTIKDKDSIHFFYAENTKYIDRLKENGHCHKVVEGEKKIDMILASFLGYLIAAEKQASYVIISNDKNYDKIISFWNKKGIRVKKQSYFE